jgi:hypothetical protein
MELCNEAGQRAEDGMDREFSVIAEWELSNLR